MKTTRMLYHLTRADFLERVRRHSFLIVVGVTVYACYLFVPPADANYVSLYLVNRRGLYNSAWLGILFGIATGMMLTLFGFYLVNSSAERDRQTGVGQIIATTPTGKIVYVLGKWLSNLAVLTLILSIQTLMAVIMQLLRAEDMTVNLWALVAPIWSMGVPVMAIVAAIAVLFESIPLLRRGFGSVAYLFLWGFVLLSSISFTGENVAPTSDILGLRWAMSDVQRQLAATGPVADPDSDFLGPKSVLEEVDPVFVWDGIEWTADILLERLAWIGVAAALAMAAAIPFDCFDPARSRLKRTRTGIFGRLWERGDAILQGDFLRRKPSDAGPTPITSTARLTPLTNAPGRGRFLGVLIGELKLMLRGHRWFWYAAAIGLNIACLASPFDVVQRQLILFVWLWPVMTWSQMGTREVQHNTGQMVFSAPHPALRQLPATWLAGVIFTVIAGSGAWIRFALMGETASLLIWSAGALVIPTLALACGVWTRSRRAFEFAYAIVWSIGLMNRFFVPGFAGTPAGPSAAGIPLVFLGISAAVIGRRRQLRG